MLVQKTFLYTFFMDVSLSLTKFKVLRTLTIRVLIILNVFASCAYSPPDVSYTWTPYSRWLRILGVNGFPRDKEKTAQPGDCLRMQISQGRPPPVAQVRFSYIF